MYRRSLFPFLVLLLGAAMAGLVLSCGGNNNNCGSYVNGQFVSGPCTIFVPPLGAQLISLNVCDGPPAGPTVKPTSSGKPSPTPTHTPCPNPTSTTAMVPNPVNFNVAGLFELNNSKYHKDLTGTAAWFVNNNNLAYSSNGQFTTVNPGCTCVTASSGGITGGPVLVSIAPNMGAVPVCSPCPTVVPPGAIATPAASAESASTSRTGVVMWRFDTRTAFDGRLAIAPSGKAVYFITADGLLHGISSSGREVFTRFSGGGSPVVALSGTIYAEASGGSLMALDADGKLRWITPIGMGAGPLAAGLDNGVYASAGDDLVAIDSGGAVRWRIAMPGVRQVITLDDQIVAVADGGLNALSASGTTQWMFAPPGGVAGDIAGSGGAIYVASSDGMLYALDAATGNEVWEREIGGSPKTGVAASANERIYIGGLAKLAAFNPAGARAFSLVGLAPESVTPAVSSNGTVFVVASGGHLAAVAPDGTLRWIAGDFGKVSSMTVSSPNALYVISKAGICWKLEEIIDNNQFELR
jgi:outer membrane protein assembly factor BamB